jgi:hypothetical protein
MVNFVSNAASIISSRTTAFLSRPEANITGVNERKIETPNGKPWSAVTVLRVQRRLQG